ncbi:hypothetical protein M404DRAFT_884831 [Pisolithus tinctorius Marx 270]|uniref:Uncharacterized protein n=1 Tax=Pisolithus tinctorius Marx 270 TaxID=870435 RepID=A0A0C3NRE7_PISTI|nr:hypothetical protein M404DRAFT_884831 [Pisolithus tinctorius Marx 270]
MGVGATEMIPEILNASTTRSRHSDPRKNGQTPRGKAPCACIAACLSRLRPTRVHDLAIARTPSHMPNSVAYITPPPSELDGTLLGGARPPR